jgi:hypothetical protein
MNVTDGPELSSQDYQDALTEVSFLLDILAATVDDLMGGGTVSVGRVAGRHQARRLPIYVEKPTVKAVISELNRLDKLGAQMRVCEDEKTLEFDHCAIRVVCKNRNIELGGNLCRLYHYYLDGIINEFLLRPTRSQILNTGTSCATRLEIQ